MKHIVYIICLLLVSISTLSQSSNHIQQIKPKWKLGDQKRVHTVSLSKIFIKDSLLNSTEVTGNYSLKVIDTVKNYTLLYSNGSGSIGIETNPVNPKLDSIASFFGEIIKKIEKETNAFKYELLVDKGTGLGFKVKNGDKYLKMVEKVAFSMIDEFGRKVAKTDTEIDSMKQKVIAYFNLAKPKILETTINEFNYLMQAYSYTFSNNSTISQKTMVHDVNALGEFGDIEMPAVLTITSQQHNNRLAIQTNTEYDKDFFLGQIKKKYKNMSELSTSDIFLSEKAEAIFTIKDSWLISHKSNIIFKLKEVQIISETIVSFQ